MTKFFGFAMSDSMFPSQEGDCIVMSRMVISPALVREYLESGDYISACNPSHVPTIQAARDRFGLEVKVPEKAPNIVLRKGDEMVIMGVRGLPRLGADRHEYTDEEIDSASFTFSYWRIT